MDKTQYYDISQKKEDITVIIIIKNIITTYHRKRRYHRYNKHKKHYYDISQNLSQSNYHSFFPNNDSSGKKSLECHIHPAIIAGREKKKHTALK